MRIVRTTLLLLIASCGTPEGNTQVAFPATPYETMPSGNYAIALRSAPSQPPTRGEMELLLSVTDSMKMGVDGLQLAVVPWMPAMGHGSSLTPTVTPRGNGDYFVSNVVLTMPGKWELRVSGAGSGTTVLSLDVE